MSTTKVLDDEPGLVPEEVYAADNLIDTPNESEIAELAYSYWEARGGTGGSPWEDWFRAEQELRQRGEI